MTPEVMRVGMYCDRGARSEAHQSRTANDRIEIRYYLPDVWSFLQAGSWLHRPGEVFVFLAVPRDQDQRRIALESHWMSAPLLLTKLAYLRGQSCMIESEWKFDERTGYAHREVR